MYLNCKSKDGVVETVAEGCPGYLEKLLQECEWLSLGRLWYISKSPCKSWAKTDKLDLGYAHVVPWLAMLTEEDTLPGWLSGLWDD